MSSPLPQHCPSPRELDDLELLLSGAVPGDPALGRPGSAFTLALPDDLAAAAELELVDPEGLPLARATRRDDGGWALVELTRPQYGPFRRLYLTPAETRERYAGRTVVPVTGPVTDVQLDQLADLGPTLLLAFVGHGTPDLSPVALLRATLRVAESLPDVAVVAVPLAAHDDPDLDHELGVTVAAAYAGDDPIVGLADGGEVLPDLDDILDADQPPADEVGLVLFFTGLSGSGKSTIARALLDRVLEQGRRTVTSLDGDVVRRHLSAGLTFSREDRETNIRRIGWVAAEIARHGGLAVCSPIAPFDETRQQVRAMVDEAGGAFFLVHVATPLEECERRDRKGLYAKARRGEIPEFTGISSPYEEPEDADVRVDTTGRSIEAALDDVLTALRAAGYLDLDPPDPSSPADATPPLRWSSRASASEFEVRAGGRAGRAPASPCRDLRPRHAGPSPPPPAPRPLRLHRQHLPLPVHGAHRPPPRRRRTRDLRQRRHPRLRRRADGPADGPRPHPARHRPDRVPQPPITPALVLEADLVITAETAHRSFILDDAPSAFRKVFTLGQLARALEPVEPGLPLPALLRALGERRGTASADLDIADPYRRGAAAAEECAQRIDTLIRTIVPRLVASVRMPPVGEPT